MKIPVSFLIFFISFFGSAQDISGSWSWQAENGEAQMEFTLEAEGSELVGHHCAVFEKGDRIDCVDETEPASIRIKRTAENIFEGRIRSGYSVSEGQVKMTFNPDKEILLFEILKPPGDLYYLPKKAFLTSGGKKVGNSERETELPYGKIREQLQGTWVLEENSKSKLVFRDDIVHKFSNGELYKSYAYSISETSPQCGEKVPVGSKFLYIKQTNLNDHNDVYCYEINTLNDQYLALIYIGGPNFRPTVYEKLEYPEISTGIQEEEIKINGKIAYATTSSEVLEVFGDPLKVEVEYWEMSEENVKKYTYPGADLFFAEDKLKSFKISSPDWFLETNKLNLIVGNNINTVSTQYPEAYSGRKNGNLAIPIGTGDYLFLLIEYNPENIITAIEQRTF